MPRTPARTLGTQDHLLPLPGGDSEVQAWVDVALPRVLSASRVF